MRHRVAHRKLGRVTEHRIAMLRNQATALIQHEHVTTTVARAKELRPFVERLVSVAKRGLANGADGRELNARRMVMQDIQDRDAVRKLFDTIAPRFAERPGGYTRLLRVGFRRGDATDLAQVEFIGSEFNPRAKAEADSTAEAAPRTTGVRSRLRAAAQRLRGKKTGDGATDGESPKKSAAKARKKKSEE